MDSLLEPLQEVFRDVFDDPDLVIGESMTANDVSGWDSLMHINLIIAVESRFGVKFATAEISSLKNVGMLAQLVADKLSETA